ncbi:MAG: topoisomerase IV [Oscillospiraceae bacterium]|jgi:DNA gyrase subunit A|nr:topoisomerase IV [Oscillospiraceae bacterium]
MAKKPKKEQPPARETDANVVGLRAATVETPITETLESNFMPYAMSVNLSRAIPEIDGFKPSQRKVLYTMYKMGLLTGGRTKSANIVGQTMRLNPHGEGAIYDTMVRMSVGYQALLNPFVDGKGNFGKAYSRDMRCAASRYTEAKLASVCHAIFDEIDSDSVDFIDNYDATMKEPALLPTVFPNILVSSNSGIGVSMATEICGFNLREVCAAAVGFLRDPDCDLLALMPAPDFPGGGEILYDEDEMRAIYETGRGGFKVRSRWNYARAENIIEVTEIPYSTTAEQIIDKVAELNKVGKLREISDMRDETGLSGLKLAIDLKRGIDPHKLMAKLFKATPLCDTYSCNFNVLIGGVPRVMGVREILDEWTSWRRECVRRRVWADAEKKREKLHLLEGLSKILLDIDRAIRTIRETDEEREVVPNLMIGFGIDEIQAEYIAEIRLRHINREYILKRVEETDSLRGEITDLEDILAKPARVRDIIITELEAVSKKYGSDRRTGIVYDDETPSDEAEDDAPDYPVTVFVSRGGYLKKITAQSLRMSGEQKFKEGDALSRQFESMNNRELLVFSDRQQCYKTRLSEFEDGKASTLGTYLPSALGFDDGESALYVCDPLDYRGTIIFCFTNGKIARVTLDGFETKTNRKKLTGAYSDKSPVAAVFTVAGETEVAAFSTDGRALIFPTALLAPKTTRNTQGVSVLSLRKNAKLLTAAPLAETQIKNRTRYLARSIPGAGARLDEADAGVPQEELTIDS